MEESNNNGIAGAYPLRDSLSIIQYGMTKREVFAMAAMQAILGGQETDSGWSEQFIAEQAVSQADALLKELNKSK